MILLLLACAGVGGDSTATTDDTAASTCSDDPVVTFETFGAGFMTENCMACHASTATNRNGAPESVIFDDPAAATAGTADPGEVDVAAVWTFADRILSRAGIAEPTMPPMGGTTDDDRYLLNVWLTCATPGT